MHEENRKTYTIRLPEPSASRLETAAAKAGVAPTTLLRLIILNRFEADVDPGKQRPAEGPEPAQSQPARRRSTDGELGHDQHYRQLLFEIGKMRSVLLHSLDHTLSAEQVDEIIEASEKAAHEYVDDLLGPNGGQP